MVSFQRMPPIFNILIQYESLGVPNVSKTFYYI